MYILKIIRGGIAMVDKKDKEIEDEFVDRNESDSTCLPNQGKYKDGPYEEKEVKRSGTYKEYKDPKREDTATDVYYKTECKLSDSGVAIPTEDSVEEAKEWVDDLNKR